jgi:hypothetical protein
MSVNPVNGEIKRRILKLSTNLLLALTFWQISIVTPLALGSPNQQSVFLVGYATLFIAGIFLVRALFNAVQIGDKTIGPLLSRLGIEEGKARERVTKDSICIIAAILCSAAISPFFNNLSSVGSSLQTIATFVVLGIVLLFVYDIGRVLHCVVEEKVDALSEWLIEAHNERAG